MYAWDSLTKHIGIIFLACMAANLANCFFHVFMSRALGPADYGILASLVSLFLILSVPTATIQITVAKYASHFKAQNNYSKINRLLFSSFTKLLLVGIAAFLIFAAASRYIASFLQMSSSVPVVIVGTSLILAFALPVGWGGLQGLQEFRALGSNMVIQVSCKLILGILLVYLGWRVSGALLAYVLSSLVAILFAMTYLSSFFQKKKESKTSLAHLQGSVSSSSSSSLLKDAPKSSPGQNSLAISPGKEINLGEIFTYSLPVALTILCFTLLTNIDIVLVKHFFTPSQAGYYSAASLVAKVIIYLPGAIGIVMFPKTSELHTLNQDSSKILGKSLFYAAFLCGLALAAFFLFPSLIIRLIFGKEYLFIIPLIGWFGLAMFFFALTNILFMYQLSLNRTRFVGVLIGATGLECLLIALFHQSLTQVISILLVVGVSLFLANSFYVLRLSLRKR